MPSIAYRLGLMNSQNRWLVSEKQIHQFIKDFDECPCHLDDNLEDEHERWADWVEDCVLWLKQMKGY